MSSLAVGEVRRIDHEGNTYALYRLGENEFAVTDGLCTHAQTHLADGHLEGGIIECPKHNGRFDVRTGGARASSPEAPSLHVRRRGKRRQGDRLPGALPPWRAP